MTPRPHDGLFKSAFEAPANAAALLRELLPAAIRDAIAWETVHHGGASFVDAVLTDSHSDLLFVAQLRARDSALIYLLLEHQSTNDSTMPLRTLSYQTRIWDRIRKEQRAVLIPPIIAVVVNHVPGGWTTSRSLEDMFDPAAMAIPELAALVPHFSLFTKDLAHLSNADFKARSLGAFQKLALWLLRDGRDSARLLDNFDAWIGEMAEVERGLAGSEAFATLVTYMFRVVDPMHRDALRAKIRQLGPRAEETAMSIADQLHEEGRKAGREEGRKAGRKEGRKAGREEGRIATLRSQLIFKFKLQTLDDRYEARLRVAPPETIDHYLQRVLIADSLAAVFED